jgi:probable HAF family extracellular repeat protein
MKHNAMPGGAAIAVLVVVAAPFLLCAQDEAAGNHGRRPRYKLVDLGTFGGPTSRASADFIGARILNDAGMATGDADTSTPDPNCNNAGCFISHVFRWQHGNLIDLGALPGANSSNATEINAQGQIVGLSSTGEIDPLTGAPEYRAVLWTGAKIVDLGTLGGTTSFATSINDRGLVVGASANTVPDPFSLFGFATETRTFIWENGVMRDIGTLGGPDSAPFGHNNRGQVIGFSYINSTPNADNGPFCAPNVPTQDPFVWQKGKMVDLGTLGGTCGLAEFINNRGQIIGQSALPGNRVSHPFLWDAGVLTDLGTLGGDNGNVSWINDAGQIVGEADLPGSERHDAFLWEKGVMTDLGNLGQTSFAFAINSKGQVVGASRANDGTIHAFLWEKGGPMIDLNAFVPEGSTLQQLTDAFNINDRGEILGVGLPPGVPPGEIGSHVFLLIPCGDDSGSCRAAGRIAVTSTGAAAPVRPSSSDVRDERSRTPIERILNRLQVKQPTFRNQKP